MKSLLNLQVLITRPIHQANELASQIQFYGGKPYNFPTIEIKAKPIKPLLPTLKIINDYDFVLFISPNAVFKTANTIKQIWPHWPDNCKIVAIGPGTALALTQYNLPVDYHPEKEFNGTGLLALPILQDIKQKRILVIKGEEGAHYLEQELKCRGAQVKRLAVYKRLYPSITKNNVPNPKKVDIIVCTSTTGLKNLVGLLYPNWQDILLKKQLLVISPGIADTAKKLGFVNPALVSDNARNIAILQTLFSWREQAYGITHPY